MGREEILLKEYEVCQKDSSSMISAHWTAAGVFLGINTAVLGAIAYGILLRHEKIQLLVLGLGVGVILIIVGLMFWTKRVSSLVNTNNKRMRQIERQLGMRKNLMVKQKEKLTGIRIVIGMYSVLVLLWIYFIVMAFKLCTL